MYIYQHNRFMHIDFKMQKNQDILHDLPSKTKVQLGYSSIDLKKSKKFVNSMKFYLSQMK